MRWRMIAVYCCIGLSAVCQNRLYFFVIRTWINDWHYLYSLLIPRRLSQSESEVTSKSTSALLSLVQTRYQKYQYFELRTTKKLVLPLPDNSVTVRVYCFCFLFWMNLLKVYYQYQVVNCAKCWHLDYCMTERDLS